MRTRWLSAGFSALQVVNLVKKTGRGETIERLWQEGNISLCPIQCNSSVFPGHLLAYGCSVVKLFSVRKDLRGYSYHLPKGTGMLGLWVKDGNRRIHGSRAMIDIQDFGMIRDSIGVW